MKILKKLSLSTVTISTLDAGKFQGGAGSKTPKCITLTPNPPTAPKLSDNPPCTDPPSPWK